MYSKFVFRNFDSEKLNKRQCHPSGAFKDVFDGTDINNVLWYSKKRIYQAKLKATEQNGATNMVALIPQSSTNPLDTFSTNTADSNKSAPWNVPSSFVLNFSTIDPYSKEPLGEYSFPYYSSYFHNTCQLLNLETKLDPYSNTRKSGDFDNIFCLPSKFYLDIYTKKTLYFIRGENFILNLLIIYKSNILASTFSTLFLQKF